MPLIAFLYPELRQVPSADRAALLRRAWHAPLNVFELVALAAVLVAGVLLTGSALAGGALAAAGMALAFLRGTRRALRALVGRA